MCAVLQQYVCSHHYTCLIVLPVRNRIQCGMGRFCLAFFAKCFLILKVLFDGCARVQGKDGRETMQCFSYGHVVCAPLECAGKNTTVLYVYMQAALVTVWS